MKTVTREYTLYSYTELSEKAKERVKEWYLEGQSYMDCIFTFDCIEYLKSLFPHSELDVEYSLNYCQGDGFNIFGKIYLDELLEQIKDHFTEKELKFFRWAFDHYGSSYEMKANREYCYCICHLNDFSENLLTYMEDDGIRNIQTDTLAKFSNLAGKFLKDLCKDFEENGYNFFYEISEEDLTDLCEGSGWLCTADGKYFDE